MTPAAPICLLWIFGRWGSADDPVGPLVERIHTAASAEPAINMMAFQFARSTMSPCVQQFPRLVIAEAARLPALGLMYWENAFLHVIHSVARCLSIPLERNLFTAPDPTPAAHPFAGMLLWIPSNETMFAVALPCDQEVRTASISAGSNAFLRAYRPKTKGQGPLAQRQGS